MKYDANLEEKKNEVSEMLSILENKELTVVQSTVLKSTIIMMLYNTVESIMSELLSKIHEEISYCQFSKLSRKIRDMMLSYFWSEKCLNQIYVVFSDKKSFPYIRRIYK
ncbi:MAG: hypothetical protein HDR32_03285 [Treponema sp.]|nr:hypothetical protein [Treponema sp.]